MKSFSPHLILICYNTSVLLEVFPHIIELLRNKKYFSKLKAREGQIKECTIPLSILSAYYCSLIIGWKKSHALRSGERPHNYISILLIMELAFFIFKIQFMILKNATIILTLRRQSSAASLVVSHLTYLLKWSHSYKEGGHHVILLFLFECQTLLWITILCH